MAAFTGNPGVNPNTPADKQAKATLKTHLTAGIKKAPARTSSNGSSLGTKQSGGGRISGGKA